ncbi:major facilitator superfamily domain-containing protein [Lipomyces japonicus]|uniref:major facilitator superfamily domain-containing protein n=1 Tax=Lipomyces japonicus TaxID=56871 RepID=UPI0034CEC4AE
MGVEEKQVASSNNEAFKEENDDIVLPAVLPLSKNRPWYKFFDEYEYRDLYERRGVQHKWWRWFDENDTPEERRYILKLDILVTSYCFISYWVKNMDSGNINNAYISGMKTDLNLGGNDLVHLQVMFTLGGVICQIPFTYLFPKVRMNWLIPGMDIIWGLFTLAQYKAQSRRELMAYRFLVGAAEASFFPGVHYVLGSWFKAHEIQRRGGIFYFGLMLGGSTTGLLQSAVLKSLDGVHGIAGWRWVFIIDAVITIPIGFLGFLTWPGTPDKIQSLFFSQKDKEIAKRRAKINGSKAPKGFSWSVVKKALTSWHLPVLIVWDVLFWNSGTQAGVFLLWLKSVYPEEKYVPWINRISAVPYAIGIGFVFIACFGADVFRSRWFFLNLMQLINWINLVILSIWKVSNTAKWYAFFTQYACWAMSSVLYGWANDILRHDDEYRSLVLILMNLMAQQSIAWTPLIFWKTTSAPKYQMGFIYAAIITFLIILWTFVVLYFFKQDERAYYFEKLGQVDHSEYELDDEYHESNVTQKTAASKNRHKKSEVVINSHSIEIK